MLCFHGSRTHSGIGIENTEHYETAKNETGHGDAGWWKRQFTNADTDPNGLLNFEELKE